MTIRQAWNRSKAWFFHTFVYRGEFYCKRTDGQIFTYPLLCPHCEKGLQKWREKRDREAGQ